MEHLLYALPDLLRLVVSLFNSLPHRQRAERLIVVIYDRAGGLGATA